MFRFSLRSLLLILLLLSAVTAWVANSYREHAQLGKDLQTLEWRVPLIACETPGPFSLWHLFGEHSIANGQKRNGRIIVVTAFGSSLNTDDDIDGVVTVLARQPQLEEITFSGVDLADEHAAALFRLPLRSLMLGECSIGGKLRLPAPRTLEWLSLHRTRIDDHSLAALGEMPSLKTLDLTRTRVGDNSIDYLASLTSLEKLIILRCRISKEGAARLKKLRPDLQIDWSPI